MEENLLPQSCGDSLLFSGELLSHFVVRELEVVFRLGPGPPEAKQNTSSSYANDIRVNYRNA